MPFRVSILFNLTTTPTDPSSAAPRSGGWSETLVNTFNSPLSLAYLTLIAAARAQMLPVQASVVGFRQAAFTISGNKIFPGGASTQALLAPGNVAYTLNLAQDSLELSAQASGAPNSTRFRLGALPDEVSKFGEYQPTSAYKTSLTNYILGLTTGFPVGSGGSFGFIGRVLTNAAVRVLSLTNTGLLTTQGAIPGAAAGSYIRFHRVFDINGNPVKGAYVTAAPVGNTYQLSGCPPQTVTSPNGTVRLDAIQVYQYAAGGMVPVRAVSKKVGRPFRGYRGRQSNRTPA
jgi:hypothetical protein